MSDYIVKENRVFPKKPEWKIVLDHIIFQDQSMTYRICRKMIIHLERMRVSEIHFLIQELNPGIIRNDEVLSNGHNWPSPKGNPFIANEVIANVFDIADKYIPDDEITNLITLWIHKEKLRNLSKVLDRRNAPLNDVVDALKKYFELGGSREFTSEDERIGVRVSIITRFLSENLRYINISKNFITLLAIEKIFNRFIGPSYGAGKVGGKSAGMILANEILKFKKQSNPKLKNVYTPKSWFLTSDGILEFINYNALDEFAFSKYQSLDEIKIEYPFLEYVFKQSHFTPEAIFSFSQILEDIKLSPIVVRSSSLLEDSFEASFTGKYKSLFLSNTGTKSERLSALMDAIAEVYASAFNPDAIEYRKKNNLIDFREEMGILIQEVVGNKIGKYFMPSYAGVALSHNEFRWSNRIKREDGVIRIVAGLGTRAVDRTMDDYPILISPGKPDIRVNHTVKDAIKYTQRYLDVINLESKSFENITVEELINEGGGTFPAIEKIFSFIKGNMLTEPISMLADFQKEEPIITFNNLIQKTDFISQIREILLELSEAYSGPVDIEFASDGEKLYLLQCRPQSQAEIDEIVSLPANIPDENKIFTANKFISNGLVDNIDFVVYVDHNGYSQLESEEEMRHVGKIVSKLNHMLPDKKFILIGPGRWGSKGDIKLGVPINYSDINKTAILVEYAKKKSDYVPELSFGTHFFQDLVEANIKYLPLYPDEKDNIFNTKFFNDTPNSLSNFVDCEDKYLDVVKLIQVNYFMKNGKLMVYMNGENSEAIGIVKLI